MRVLVTGGAGYIGSVAVEQLLNRGHDVVVIDNLSRGHPSAVPAAVELIDCDLRDAARTAQVVGHAVADAVLHFAAATIVPESMERPVDYFGINVVGSHNLLAALVEHGVQRLVFSSTAAVYGMPDQSPVTESASTNPINPYGRSKLIVEQMLEWYDAAYGLRYAALRYFNVAGATSARGEDHRPETHVIPVALQTLLGQHNVFRVFGTDYPTPDGTAVRDYVHVLDLVEAHLHALDRLDQTLGPLNIGTKDGFSVKQIVDAVERVTGRDLPVEYAPRRAGDPPTLIADSSRARELLAWSPVHSTLDAMIESAWEWSQQHPTGYVKQRRVKPRRQAAA